MTALGLVIVVGMLGPPIAGYYALRRAKRSALAALCGALILWALCMVVLFLIALVADRLHINQDFAMWFYLPVLALVLIGMIRKYWNGA